MNKEQKSIAEKLLCEAKESARKWNQIKLETITKLLSEAEEDIRAGNILTSEEAFEAMNAKLKPMMEEIHKQQDLWIEKRGAAHKPYVEEDMLTYFEQNKPRSGSALEHQYWQSIGFSIRCYQRFLKLFPILKAFVVGEFLYPKSPYAEEGSLPIILFRLDDKELYFFPIDPIENRYFILARRSDVLRLGKTFKNTFSPRFWQTRKASLPNKLIDALGESDNPLDMIDVKNSQELISFCKIILR